jgi:hypothetical protein
MRQGGTLSPLTQYSTGIPCQDNKAKERDTCYSSRKGRSQGIPICILYDPTL